ncbi:MAG: MFS transporter [Fimbriimonadaceae bacterium]|nr:MFS transporter [Fimbriimonadaceae bacterium]
MSRGSTRGALAGLSLSMLLCSMNTSIANAGLPALASALGASFAQVQWIVLAYLLAITALIVGAGRLGDVLGRRRLLLAGVSLFTLASVLCGLAPSLGALVAGRAAQGLGAALMMALTVAFVGDTVPQGRTGSAMGLLGTLSAVGTALGPSLGGLLLANLGWRALFLVNVPLGVVALALAWRHLPADPKPSDSGKGSFDVLGTALLAGVLSAYALALTTARGSFGLLNAVLLVVALAGAALFVRMQARVRSPLLEWGMLRDPVLGGSLTASGLVSTVMMSTLVVGPFYLARTLSLGDAMVGIVLTVGPLVAALAGVPAGRLTDRLGAQRVSGVGLAAMAGGALLLVVAPTALGVPGYAGPLALLTAGYALFQTANNTVVMVGIPPDRRGVVSAILSLSRNLGLITGASLMGAVFARASGAAEVTLAPAASVATGMRVTYAFAALLIVAAWAVLGRARAVSPQRVGGCPA